MAEIRLLSIKRNEEASYFYENNVSTTLDSNRNEVVEVQENHKAPQISKKARKEEERRSKKGEKQKIKETKQREKEKKKSLKNSRKEVVGSVDTARPSGRAEIKTNGDVKSNGGFQVGMDVGEAAENKNEESLNDHEEDRNENEESREEHNVTRHEHEEASNQNKDLSEEHEGVSSEHESSIKTHDESTHVEITAHATSSEEPGASGETHATSSERHADLELSSENCVEKTREVEETITVDSVQTTEEAPKEIFHQPKVNPDIPEPTGGQHLEIEISEVTDPEADASSSDQVVVMQNSLQTSTYPSSAASEGQILVATVQQVESGVDLDGVFAKCYAPADEEDKEEKRKSVRFQEETEEIGHGEVESKDHEHASMNLGGDFTGTTDDDSVEPPQTLEPAVEVVSKEEGSKVESCVDLEHVFAPSEREANDIETVPEENHVEVVKVNGSAKVNGKAKVINFGTKTDDLVEIDLNESNEHKNTATKTKEKRKKSGLVRCCFP